jgi:hypothetical protein
MTKANAATSRLRWQSRFEHIQPFTKAVTPGWTLFLHLCATVVRKGSVRISHHINGVIIDITTHNLVTDRTAAQE